jgi:myosin heavy subunit
LTFSSGILAKMEDIRDEKLAGIMKGFQAQIRWSNELVRTSLLSKAKFSYF